MISNYEKLLTQFLKEIHKGHRPLAKKWLKIKWLNKDKRIVVDFSISENKIIYRCYKCNHEFKMKRGVLGHLKRKECPPLLRIYDGKNGSKNKKYI